MLLRIFLFLFLTLSQVNITKAQLINVEQSRKESKPGFQGHIDLSLILNQNTRQIFEIGSTAHVQYNRNRHTLLVLNNLNYMQVEGDNLINNGFQHLRYNYTYGSGFTIWEGFVQHQYNSIRLLQRRFLLGAGPRFKVFENDNLGFYLAPLVIIEQEKLNDENKTLTEKFKGNFYVSATYKLDERVNFTHTTYYQPDFAQFNEYRLASDTGVQLKFTEQFTFTITYSLAYDSDPPNDIPGLFYTLRNGIKYSF